MNEPSIGLVYDALTGYQRTAALRTAVELDVFTAIGEGADTPAALATRCRAAERGLRALCDHLVVDGFLTPHGGSYALTPTAAAFLDRRSPACIGSATTFIASSMITDAFARLTEAVRRGGTAMEEEGTLGPEHPVWVQFARAMGPIAGMSATLLANLLEASKAPRWRVLDIAAGHGMFGITLARENPNATITALDWRNVLAVAQENATAAGVAGRFRTLPGSAFEVDWGRDYDLVLLPNFLHHFDPSTCEDLLRRAHAALAPNGRVVIVEFVPDEDRSGPPEALGFRLVMLATTPSGDAYTFAEYERMLRAAGFARATLHQLIPSPNRAIIAE